MSNAFKVDEQVPAMHRLLSSCLLSLSLLLLSACSSYAPPTPVAGLSRESIEARMGPSATVRQLASGSVLEFPSGPYGFHTWFVYLETGGRAVRAEQVLTEQNFLRVTPGMMQEEVRQLLGKPGETYALARARGVVWSYRYENQDCRWFQVELTQEKTVRSAGLGQLPECDPRRDD